MYIHTCPGLSDTAQIYPHTCVSPSDTKSHLTVEQSRSPGDRPNLRRGGHRRQRGAPGEVAAAADADSGEAGVEVVAVKVQESEEEGARVHLAGLFLEIPFLFFVVVVFFFAAAVSCCVVWC